LTWNAPDYIKPRPVIVLADFIRSDMRPMIGQALISAKATARAHAIFALRNAYPYARRGVVTTA
jgi:hypothetical protein